jgi:hypothetical protein
VFVDRCHVRVSDARKKEWRHQTAARSEEEEKKEEIGLG